MKIKNFLLTLIAITAFAFNADAQTTKKEVTKKQVNQNARIHQGVRSGELTKRETKQLKAQQRDINQTKRAAKADGKVTAKERATIKHKQTKASANIARKKNNNKSR
ncbi:hypothetical protein [Aureispira anguillae]|uniref:DUF4148 domain-containing protein n=1 Tax=Aureispira anguillae TaxID=2864201 RepID=A0A916DVY3_9BACT|nr:hypothetical protein [Aureispira anguillae]BDS14080.1 hypothetical protein AsAng_0048460 [Aureispira anguillae]